MYLLTITHYPWGQPVTENYETEDFDKIPKFIAAHVEELRYDRGYEIEDLEEDLDISICTIEYIKYDKEVILNSAQIILDDIRKQKEEERERQERARKEREYEKLKKELGK